MTEPAWVGRAITPSNTDLDYLTQAATLAQAAANTAMTGGGVGHTLTLAGGLSGVSFNGSADVTTAVISAPVLSPGATINGVLFDGSGPITITATVAHALTAGTHLAGGPYDGSAAVTLTTDATSANTASTIVARDASGNFTAGTIAAALTGNASTATLAAAATALATPRAINGVNFDGTAPITITAASAFTLTLGTGLSGTSYNGSANVTATVTGAPASGLTGTTLPASIITSSLTTIGTLVGGQVNAQFVTSGTFGSASGDTNPYLFSQGIVLGASHTPTPSLITPQANNFTVYGDNATQVAVLRIYNAGQNGRIALGTYNGTPASPTAVISGNILGQINFQGYDGTTTTMDTGAGIQGVATQNWSNTALGTKLIFQTKPNGSTTLTTALTLDQDQSATFAGAVSMGALAATTGTFSGLINGIAAGQAFRLSGQGTGFQYMQLDNTGALGTLGIESSTGGSLFSGSSAYAQIVGTANATALNLGTNATVRLTIAGGGTINALADFSVATSKFTVASASGNTAVAGTLGVTGLSTVAALTTSGLITANAGLTVASGQTLTLTGATVTGLSFTTLTSSGAATLDTGASGSSFGGALGVTGLLTLSNNILLANGQTINWGGVGTGTWISASTAGNDIQMLVNAAPVLTLTTSLVQCGQPLRLANAYVSGVIAATGHVTIQDSTGTTYQVLCHT